MTDPIRKQILDAYVSQLENVTTDNGYRQSIVTAKVLAKDWSFDDITNDDLPWAGVIPQEEIAISHLPFGYQECEWPIWVVVHMKIDTYTPSALITACENVRTDVRRALYTYPQLDVQGVLWARVENVHTSEASQAALEHGIAGVIAKTRVKFRESVTAS